MGNVCIRFKKREDGRVVVKTRIRKFPGENDRAAQYRCFKMDGIRRNVRRYREMSKKTFVKSYCDATPDNKRAFWSAIRGAFRKEVATIMTDIDIKADSMKAIEDQVKINRLSEQADVETMNCFKARRKSPRVKFVDDDGRVHYCAA